ncbi:ABC transporter permease [Algivirga pacifica]|uniref:ABC transporter permease n=1 Tax=Algivirga pacifica TaxID=1162670 RepID=A0ABP9DM24_9BACT
MLRSYIIVAVRNLFKHKLFSILNILGLSIGIAFFTFLILIVRYEWSFDQQYPLHQRTYRVVEHIQKGGTGEKSASMPVMFGPHLQQKYPELVENYVRLFNFQTNNHTLEYQEKTFISERLYYTDPSYLSLFPLSFKEGSLEQPLNEAKQAIISTKVAQELFGNESPIGKFIKHRRGQSVKITGVFVPSSQPTHLAPDVLISLSTLDYGREGSFNQKGNKQWLWNPCWTYLLLKEGRQPEEVEYHFEEIIEEKYPKELQGYTSIYLQPLTEIHLFSKLDYELSPNGDIIYIYIFALLAIVVLVIAGINFSNLSMARYSSRFREIGIRKSIGATDLELVDLFLVETLLICFVSMFFALLLSESIMSLLTYFDEQYLLYYQDNMRTVIACIIASGLVVGILASIYPIHYILGRDPSRILQNKRSTYIKGTHFRKGMIVTQIALTIFLVMSSIVSIKQFNHLTSASLGFDSNNIMVVPLGDMRFEHSFDTLKAELLASPDITAITAMDFLLGAAHQTHFFLGSDSANTHKSSYLVPGMAVRDGFFDTFNIPLLAGRRFSSEQNDGAKEVIINHAMSKILGYHNPENALGQLFYFPHRKDKQVITGVVPDINYRSLHEPSGPFVFFIHEQKSNKSYRSNYLFLRMKRSNPRSITKHINQVWRKLGKKEKANTFLLKSSLKKLYFQEVKLVRISLFFSAVGILITVLGLFGLSFFEVSKKAKEVAIRKSLGATNPAIMLFLTKEFITLVLIAITVAWPISYAILQNWLNGFPSSTSVGWEAFAISGITALLVMLTTVSYHTIKAGLKNPVEDL